VISSFARIAGNDASLTKNPFRPLKKKIKVPGSGISQLNQYHPYELGKGKGLVV
jgi:hypothetical protein